jgi:hypothetical protein
MRADSLREAAEWDSIRSIRTVRLAKLVMAHVCNIFEKSGTHSRAEFLAAVLRTK